MAGSRLSPLRIPKPNTPKRSVFGKSSVADQHIRRQVVVQSFLFGDCNVGIDIAYIKGLPHIYPNPESESIGHGGSVIPVISCGTLPQVSLINGLQDLNPGADAVQWLVSGVENLNLDGKAWAGASHWRFRARRDPEEQPVDAAPKPAKRTNGR